VKNTLLLMAEAGLTWRALPPPSSENAIHCPTAVPNFFMAYDKAPLVLLHPILLSGRVWHDVVPLLSSRHQVYAYTLLGHRGGAPIERHPATVADVLDAAEQYLDDHRLERPHLVGNSTGGFVAIELARRGRAATVCALSPAGFWSKEDGSWDTAASRARRIAAVCRLTRPFAPLMFKSPYMRRLALRSINVAWRADQVEAARAVEAVEDTVACTVTVDEVFSTEDGKIEPLDPLPCPITLAWGQKDSLFPLARYGNTARERLPEATFEVLPDVGHVPMFDDPQLVARTILGVTGVEMPQR
jgi:pimeloyl-ACP methyl ester carboxylesterase